MKDTVGKLGQNSNTGMHDFKTRGFLLGLPAPKHQAHPLESLELVSPASTALGR